MKRRAAGYSLLEVVVAMAVFGTFLLILGVLTVQMRSLEKRMPVNFMRHPQLASLITKLRRDVLDASAQNTYPASWQGYTQTSKTLIIESLRDVGGVETVVWDFREPRVAYRRAWNVGVETVWTARGLPEDFSTIELDAIGIPGRPYGVRITAKDGNGRIAIDQILQPRAYQ